LAQYVSPYLNGSFAAPTFAFYDFFKYELGVKFEATGTPVEDANKNGSKLDVDALYEIWKTLLSWV
jgi:hypothetical protein